MPISHLQQISRINPFLSTQLSVPLVFRLNYYNSLLGGQCLCAIQPLCHSASAAPWLVFSSSTMTHCYTPFTVVTWIRCNTMIAYKTQTGSATPTLENTLFCPTFPLVLQYMLGWTHNPSGYLEDMHQVSSLFWRIGPWQSSKYD